MSDRKYSQRGYQDDPRNRSARPVQTRKPEEPGAPVGARRLTRDGMKAVSTLSFRQVLRCTQCGAVVNEDVGLMSRCDRCSADLHSCAQCTSFDPGSRFECSEAALTSRVSPKNERNECSYYSPRTTVEREVTAPRPDTARKAFDDLFKF
jgi:hypothetical protein